MVNGRVFAGLNALSNNNDPNYDWFPTAVFAVAGLLTSDSAVISRWRYVIAHYAEHRTHNTFMCEARNTNSTNSTRSTTETGGNFIHLMVPGAIMQFQQPL